VPGATKVGTVSRLPLHGGSNGNVWVEGRPPRTESDQGPLVEGTSISGDYFAAMGITLLEGRTLLPQDSATNAVNVVINHHFAEEAWPGQDPLGKRFSFSDNPPAWNTVVGVVDDVRQWGPEQPPVSQVYWPLTRGWTSSGYLVVRTPGDPAALAQAVRRAVLAVDPTQAPSDIHTMTSVVDRSYAQRRFYTTLIGLFALAALFLAAAGIYGTVSYYVARRGRELGIRMALGAGGAGIVGLVLRRSIRLAAWGVALGLAGVWASTSVVAKLLYGIGALDPLTLVGGCLALVAVAVAAAALPARRAVRVPPMMALRSE
jgi:predicted permease